MNWRYSQHQTIFVQRKRLELSRVRLLVMKSFENSLLLLCKHAGTKPRKICLS